MRGLDWPGLMRAGLGPRQAGGLGLTPAEFWHLTPAELALMLGVSLGAGAMTRERLAALSALYPDAAPEAANSAAGRGIPDDPLQEKERAHGG